MASLKYWIWLTTRRSLSTPVILAVLDHFGTPEAAHFAAAEEYDQIPGLTPLGKRALLDKSLDGANAILSACEETGQRILTIQDAGYPERLRNIFDPPAVLYLKGRDIPFDDEVAVGLIGTRTPTAYGISQTDRLGHDLAVQGAVVVSGLARGLDSDAIRGALRGGGAVCGVLGCGLDVFYPSENRFLYQDVAARGVLISEYPPGTEPRKEHFPARNRIISGLSLGVVVVEGGSRSGTQITVKNALDQNRDVFAVPGPLDGPMSIAPNRLIRNGEAKLITSASDILEEYETLYPHKLRLQPGLTLDIPAVVPGVRPAAPPAATPAKTREPEKKELPVVNWRELTPALTDDQRDILLTLREGPMVMEEIIETAQIPARRCTSAVTMLQLAGFLEETAGKRFAATVRVQE